MCSRTFTSGGGGIIERLAWTSHPPPKKGSIDDKTNPRTSGFHWKGKVETVGLVGLEGERDVT